MTLFEHLTELRQRLVKAILAVTTGAVVVFILYDRVLDFLLGYYRDATNDPNAKFVIFSPLEGVTTRLTVASYGGIIFAMPVLMWQLWQFIAPGLHQKERRYAIPFVASSVLLFFCGAGVALLTLPQALDFLVTVSGDNVETLFGPAKFINFVTLLIVAFGFSFEFPVVLIFLMLARVITYKQLLGVWRYAIVGIFILAALATPSQDPWSLLGMALPMTVFYFGSILVGRLLRR